MAEVDAEQRACSVPWVSSAARRIVPSPPMTSDQLAALARQVVRLRRLDESAGGGPRVEAEVGGLVGQEAYGDAVRGQRLDAGAGDLARLGAAGVGEHQHAAPRSSRRSRVHPLTRHPQRGRPLHLGADVVRVDRRRAAAQPAGRTRRCRTGPGSGLAVTATAPQPRAAARSATAVTASARSPGRARRRPCRPGPCRPRTAA